MLDPTEDGGSNPHSYGQQQQDRVFEGMGMMSWLLAEKMNGSSRVVGRVAGTQDMLDVDRTLEVVLELMPVRATRLLPLNNCER